MDQKQPKFILTSKTARFGVTLAVMGLAILSLPEVKDFITTLSPDVQGIATLVVGILIVVLRQVTDSPVSWQPPQPSPDEDSG